jgi:hypothetical protein
MPDTKITALAAITTVAPANDLFAIVDVSDNSMAASGTTKNITTNQILGSGGTATLASATITGDLTVRTNKLKVDSTGVAIGATSASYLLDVRGTDTTNALIAGTTKGIRFVASASTSSIVGVDNTGAASYQPLSIGGTALDFSLSGSTAMTLNSTGLGVGIGPSYRLTIGAQNPTGGNIAQFYNNATSSLNGAFAIITQFGVQDWYMGQPAGVSAFTIGTGTTSKSEFFRIDGGGNVGVGVTPSAWAAAVKALQIGATAAASYDGTNYDVSSNRYLASGGTSTYIATGFATMARQVSGQHLWYNAPSGTAGNAITFTQAMTLDASGNLLVGKTSASVTTVGFQTLPSGEASVAMTATTGAATTLNVYSTGAAAYRFFVGMNGTISATNTTISAISDARLKENVEDIDVGLGAILALKPRKFDWKAGKGKDIKGDRGFIAQEFEQVFPQLVDEWKDPAPEGEAPYKSVRQDLIPVLVKAIQELTARVQTLEAK